MTRHKDQPAELGKDLSDFESVLILFNDDVNTFDFVIESLIEICHHGPEQAEQCAMIAHLKGKCAVKSGNYMDLKGMCDELNLRGLTVSLE
jgi:ATP-dependent Clp protease adaptor protein ClpS